MVLFELYNRLPDYDYFGEVMKTVSDCENEHLTLIYEKLVRCIINNTYASYDEVSKNNCLDLPVFNYLWQFTPSSENGCIRGLGSSDIPTVRNSLDSWDEIFSQKVIPSIFSIEGWEYFVFETRSNSYIEEWAADESIITNGIDDEEHKSVSFDISELDDEQFLSVYFELNDLLKNDDNECILSILRVVAESDSCSDFGRSVLVLKNTRIPTVVDYINSHSTKELESLFGEDIFYAKRLLELIKNLGYEVTMNNVYSYVLSSVAQYWVIAPYNEDEYWGDKVSLLNSANVRFYLTPLLINQCLDALEPYIKED